LKNAPGEIFVRPFDLAVVPCVGSRPTSPVQKASLRDRGTAAPAPDCKSGISHVGSSPTDPTESATTTVAFFFRKETLKKGGVTMADLTTTDEDAAAIKAILLQWKSEGNPNPLLPADVDIDGDGIVDSFGLDENDNVIVVSGTKL